MNMLHSVETDIELLCWRVLFQGLLRSSVDPSGQVSSSQYVLIVNPLRSGDEDL